MELSSAIPGANATLSALEQTMGHRELLSADHRQNYDRYVLLLHRPAFSIYGSWLKSVISGKYLADELAILLINLLKEELRSDLAGLDRVSRIDSYLEGIDQRAKLSSTIEILNWVGEPSWIDLQTFAHSFEHSILEREPSLEYVAGIESEFRRPGAFPLLESVSYLISNPGLVQYSTYPSGQTQPAAPTLIEAVVKGEAYSMLEFNAGCQSARQFIEQYTKLVSVLAFNACNCHFVLQLMISRKAGIARCYHGSAKDYGFSFDDLFSTDMTRSQKAINALYQSPLINAQRPRQSALIAMNESKTSKMFRIFSPGEIEIIVDWIENYSSCSQTAVEAIGKVFLASSSSSELPSGSEDGSGSKGIRNIYNSMINLRYPFRPKIKQKATDYIDLWIANSRSRTSEDLERGLPKEYPGFRCIVEWVETRHSNSFRTQTDGDLPAKERVIAETTRQSPLVLLDGVWLLGLFTSNVGMAYPELLDTADDELGNGKIALNHPAIYRNVLKKMGVSLPPTQSVEFCMSSAFEDSDFYLPLYWMAMMVSGDERLSYLIGLNLAIELAGVGATYRNTSENLKRYGFPTIFTDLHNSIDNASSGHSFLALKAADRYLKSVPRSQQKKSWDEIKDGYNSLFFRPSYFVKKKLIQSLA